jgi:23S rRNA pseudouridine2605 synthase
MRLNAFLAKAGVASRRGADKLIKAGRVKVNGEAGQLNSEVTEKDIVKVDGGEVLLQQNRYILLNKPAKYLTSLKDPHGRRTVIDLIDIPARVVPVGRLDWDTTGALLLTNDGELANQLMHPRYEIDKAYQAQVFGEVTEKTLEMLNIGIELDDGKTAPAKARKLADNEIEIIIHEGRNRQVKRMLAAVGLPVKKLHRSKYGPLALDGLKPGEWRDLSHDEIKNLKHAQ